MMEQPFLRQESAATSHAAWSPRSPAYEASRLRFYVLFVLSFFSCMQCACWFAFSSVDPALVKAYMGAPAPNDAGSERRPGASEAREREQREPPAPAEADPPPEVRATRSGGAPSASTKLASRAKHSPGTCGCVPERFGSCGA